MVFDDVFSNPIEPRVEGRVAPERLGGAERFQPGLLGQVFGKLRVFDTAADVGIQTLVVFGNDRTESFGIALLCARNEGVFVKIKQSCLFLIQARIYYRLDANRFGTIWVDHHNLRLRQRGELAEVRRHSGSDLLSFWYHLDRSSLR